MSTLWKTNPFYSHHADFDIASAITFHYIKADEQQILQDIAERVNYHLIAFLSCEIVPSYHFDDHRLAQSTLMTIL